MISKDLQNQKFKAEILRRVFPNGDELGCHKFRLDEPTCVQCSQSFWDWLEETPEGVSHKAKMCNVIGRDEVERFRTYEY